MDTAAVVIVGVWLGLGVFGRMALQRLRTGSWGLRLPTAGELAGRLGQLLATVGMIVLGSGVVISTLRPLGHLRVAPTLGGIALGVALAGLLGMLAAQLMMGNAWRIGVDQDERTALVTGGPFGSVRNPIFTTMLTTALGLTVVIPSAITIVGLVMSMLGTELIVRRVEEPYLLATHGDAFRSNAGRVGRFLPALGRLP